RIVNAKKILSNANLRVRPRHNPSPKQERRRIPAAQMRFMDSCLTRFPGAKWSPLRLKTLGTRRLGVADDALDGGEGAAQCALDLVDALMHLDHAHRGRGTAVEVDDLAGLGIAHPHIMDVVDGAISGNFR